MDILDWVGKNISWLSIVCLILSFVFEVTKIPINPWQWLFKNISNIITQPLNEKLIQIEEDRKLQYEEISSVLAALKERMDMNEYKADERYIKELRMKIIDFAGSIRNGKINSREAYEEIMRIYEDYHETLSIMHESNGYIDSEYELIKESFKERSKTNDFCRK